MSNVHIWNSTARLLHQVQSFGIHGPRDLKTEELLHLDQLLGDRADAQSGCWALCFCQVKKPLQVALMEGRG